MTSINSNLKPSASDVVQPAHGTTLPRPPGWSELAVAQMKLQQHRDGSPGLKRGPYWVTETMLRRVWRLFWRNAASLDPGLIYDAEGLACLPDWGDLRKAERIVIGMSFKYLALHRVLPITPVDPAKTCNVKYRLNPGLEQTPTSH
jgi:hypothetical protein